MQAWNLNVQRFGEESFLARYAALLLVSRAIGSYRDPKELFRVLADELRRAVDFSFIGVFLYDVASNTVRTPLLATVNARGFAIPSDFPAEETITCWVYYNQKPVVITPRDRDNCFPRMMDVFRRYAVESVVLPLTT